MKGDWLQVENSVFIPKERVESVYVYSRDSVIVYCLGDRSYNVQPPWAEVIIEALGEMVHPVGAELRQGGV